MARRLIGLDIGTNAVTVAEVRPGDPPRLEMFGRVAREQKGPCELILVMTKLPAGLPGKTRNAGMFVH